jgi:hypothetical protein
MGEELAAWDLLLRHGRGLLPWREEDREEEKERRLLSCREPAPWTEARLEQARVREKELQRWRA